MPALTVLLSFQRAILVNSHQTQPSTVATALEVGGIIAAMLIAINVFDLVGAIAASVALMIGRSAANGYLLPPLARVIPKF